MDPRTDCGISSFGHERHLIGIKVVGVESGLERVIWTGVTRVVPGVVNVPPSSDVAIPLPCLHYRLTAGTLMMNQRGCRLKNDPPAMAMQLQTKVDVIEGEREHGAARANGEKVSASNEHAGSGDGDDVASDVGVVSGESVDWLSHERVHWVCIVNHDSRVLNRVIWVSEQRTDGPHRRVREVRLHLVEPAGLISGDVVVQQEDLVAVCMKDPEVYR